MIPESALARGRGNYLYDVEGGRYLDGTSWLWGNTLGHAEPDLGAAAHAQLDRLNQLALGGEAVPGAKAPTAESLEDMLGQVLPVREPRLVLAPDGPTAVAWAAALALRHSRDRKAGVRSALLVFSGAAHLFDPSPFAVIHTVGYHDPGWLAAGLAALERHSERLAAVIIEPLVQGAAGPQVADPADVASLADAVQASGIPLICDEVLTGFGRTGTLFAAEQCLITADVLCLGSSLTGGSFPIGAMAVAAHIGANVDDDAEAPAVGRIGEALARAVAVRHLELLSERRTLDHVAEMSAHLRGALTRVAAHRAVRTVSGRGLMMGVGLEPGRPGAEQVCAAVLRRGVLLRPLDEQVVGVVPPLSITRPEIGEIAGALLGALDEVGA